MSGIGQMPGPSTCPKIFWTGQNYFCARPKID